MIAGFLLLCLATAPQCDRWSAALVIEGRFGSVAACEAANMHAMAVMLPGSGYRLHAQCVAGPDSGRVAG